MSGNEVPDSGYQLLLDTAFIIPSTAAKYAHILNTAYYILYTTYYPRSNRTFCFPGTDDQNINC